MKKMIEAYFGFKSLPFSKDIKTRSMYESFDVKEAEARLSYLKQYRGIMLLTGEPGSGKTSITRRFVEELNPQTYLHCYTPHATVTRGDLYRQINALLRLPGKTSKSDLFEQVQRSILDLYQHQGKVTCIILDECQLMDHTTLQELVLMMNFEMDSKLPFILILIGQPAFKETLNRRVHEPLKQRIGVRYHMTGLGQEETKAYVESHLKLVGRKDGLFEENAFQIIHQLSHGLPRKIGSVCLAALQHAMGKRLQSINGDLIVQIAPEI
jgi:type II secretory pathway predicted ATPase ExeA